MDWLKVGDMDKPLTTEEWAVRALLALLRKSREAVRQELLRKAANL